jgi:phospholipid/cholesterol/gamma-HCH transport system permease protein
MSATNARRPAGPLEQAVVGTRPYESIVSAAEMGALALIVLRTAVTPPFKWLSEAVVEMSSAYRRVVFPAALSMVFFSLTFLTFIFGQVLLNLGVSDRVGGAFFVASVREISVWVTTMVFAGVAGSAVAADLGARKIREELDALSVLGVKHAQTLATPRVIAMTVIAPVIGFTTLLAAQVTCYVAAPAHLGQSSGVYRDNVASNIIPVDLWAYGIKFVLIGFFVGLVACQKGLTAKGGAEGVGRAVHQTVVLSFAGIWVVNALFNLAFLALFPETSIPKG